MIERRNREMGGRVDPGGGKPTPGMGSCEVTAFGMTNCGVMAPGPAAVLVGGAPGFAATGGGCSSLRVIDWPFFCTTA